MKISLFDSILPEKPKLYKSKLVIYFFSFWGVHQNFEVIAGLNYRFIGNQRVHVFSTCKTEIMTNTNDFNTCRTGTGRCFKNVCWAFSLVHISFSKNLWILIFQPNFIFCWQFVDLLLSANIHVFKIISWNIANVWHIIFFLRSF